MATKYAPGTWRAKRAASGRIEVVRVDARGFVVEKGPVSYAKWERAKFDADTWNEMEASQ